MIQTETTPNPNALKFISESKLSEIGAKEFHKKDIKPNTNNLIKNLLEFDGVELVLVSDNFISVKKFDNAKWDSLRPSIISEINDHLVKNKKPILLKNSEILEKPKKESNLIVEEIKKVLDSKIRPAVAKDGGDIKFISFQEGTVKVELKGSCSGCPSSIITLKNGVQNLLRHYIKEVKNVEAI